MDNLADSWRTNSYARWDRIVTRPEDSVNGCQQENENKQNRLKTRGAVLNGRTHPTSP